jgi:putative methionine-R-sulfoxide reductase with GAF domain
VSTGTDAAIERILADGQDADDVLRGAVAALACEPGIVWAGICFLEDDALALGPTAGAPDDERRTRVPISFQGAVVGELWADGVPDRELLERIASLIAPQVLIGWDTGGEAWEP